MHILKGGIKIKTRFSLKLERLLQTPRRLWALKVIQPLKKIGGVLNLATSGVSLRHVCQVKYGLTEYNLLVIQFLLLGNQR